MFIFFWVNIRVKSQTACEYICNENLGYLPGEAEEHSCGDASESENYANV